MKDHKNQSKKIKNTQNSIYHGLVWFGVFCGSIAGLEVYVYMPCVCLIKGCLLLASLSYFLHSLLLVPPSVLGSDSSTIVDTNV